jgi:hypothetical protein
MRLGGLVGAICFLSIDTVNVVEVAVEGVLCRESFPRMPLAVCVWAIESLILKTDTRR